MSFEVTTAVRKMLAMQARKKVIQGATSSGKTYGIIPILTDKAIYYPNQLTTVTAETFPSLKKGAITIFKDFMFDVGRWNDKQWNGSDFIYTFKNRSRIEFAAFDSVGKAKAAGKRHRLFINEANHVPYEIADALITRTTDEIILDFNADMEFWAHTNTLKEPNSEFLKLTYLDNEAIPEGTLEELMIKRERAMEEDRQGKRGYWWNWWQVYGLGEIGALQGAVFNNWSTCDVIPSAAKHIGTGLDFGYSNDPTSIVEVYEYKGEYYWDLRLYRTGMTNGDIAKFIKSERIKGIIYADSAEPKSIEEIRRYGIAIRGVDKGRDSISYGIDLIQDAKFYVTLRSVELQEELRKYLWATDRTGRSLNKPIDLYNHAIDAGRYVYVMRNKYKGRYSVGNL